MKWTRRHFLEATGGLAAAVGLGLTPGFMKRLSGHAVFEDWRALPGMVLNLSVEVASPEGKQVTLLARTAEGETSLGDLACASQMQIEIPYIRTGHDSYELIARVSDRYGRYFDSDAVEVLTESFQFGM